jgi:class 3 adenylate cyclase
MDDRIGTTEAQGAVTATGMAQDSATPRQGLGVEPRVDGARACVVLFLDVVGYSKRSVSEQQAIKQALNADVRLALHGFPRQELIALDTGDGVAITFLNDLEQAFAVALKLQTYLRTNRPRRPAFEARIGINLGPVKLVQDINGQTNVIGDGINVAQRIMSFAAPGRVLVSGSYYEMMSRLKSEYAQAFLIAGPKFDKHAREHCVYELCEIQTGHGQCGRRGTVSNRRGSADYGVNLRRWSRPAVIASLLLVSSLVICEAPSPKATLQPSEPRAQAGVIKLAISPWGRVLVDGKVQGASPPLTQIRLAPGRHRIEVRNATLKPHIEEVELLPNQSATIRHRFVQGQTAQPKPTAQVVAAREAGRI